MINKAYRFGKLLVTTTSQAQNAPFIDSSMSRDADGNRYKGIAILLQPWRRNQYGESLIQPSLVLAWRVGKDKSK